MSFKILGRIPNRNFYDFKPMVSKNHKCIFKNENERFIYEFSNEFLIVCFIIYVSNAIKKFKKKKNLS